MARSDDFLLTAEELRLRRHKRRRVLIVLVLLLGLVLAAIFAGRPTLDAIKAFQARRHAKRAFALLEGGKWADAGQEAVAAYQLRPTEPEALRAVAHHLSLTQQREALDFWQNLRTVAPLAPADFRDEAMIALIYGEADRAAEAINTLLANEGKNATAEDWLVAAQAAMQKGAMPEAQRYLQKIFEGKVKTERDELHAAMLELQASAESESEANKKARADGWSRITLLATGKSDIALEALSILARRALAGDASATMKSADLIRALENHPLAKAPQKLLALDLQLHDNPTEKKACIARAIADWKDADPTALVALATWLNAKGEYERELEVIPLQKALQTRDLFLQRLDALGPLGRWDEIRHLLEAERFPLDAVTQQMYLARCAAELGEKAAEKNSWQRALEAAGNNTQKLMALAEYAEKSGTLEIAEIAYSSAVTGAPKLRAAHLGRLRVAQAQRDTRKIHGVLEKMMKSWPNDTAIQNDEAYTRLLLWPEQSDPSHTRDLASIEQRAEELLRREPSSLPHRTLLALARLKQGRAEDALRVYANLRVAPSAMTPSALAIQAAVLAATNHFEEAKTEARQIPSDRLLSEERALIQSLL